MRNKFEITVDDLGIDYQDEGPWRSYMLESYGDTFEEFWDNAQVTEIDKDGGELSTYHVLEADREVFGVAEKILLDTLHKKTWRAM